MYSEQDKDIKIAGDRPSEDIKRNRQTVAQSDAYTAAEGRNAKALGADVARLFIDDAAGADSDEGFRDYALLLQRRLLLSFAATIGFEQYVKNETLGGLAQKSFLDTVRGENPELYRSSSDTGAFSFYYLAYRRGGDTERRIGQTFAMLCSHDGDPIFQELGEALYCWFSSEVKKRAEELGLL